MKVKEFLVQGSSLEPYKVTFIKDGSKLTALCNCPAGEHGQYCKHRFRIMEGIADGIVSNNKKDLDVIISWLEGTELDVAYKEVKDAERIYEEAKYILSNLKKRLARIMCDGNNYLT